MATPLVSFHKVDKSFAQKHLFSGLSFGIQSGQRLALLGPNGAGKSTLLKIMAGLETVDDGEVTLNSQIRVVYVAQEDSFESDLSVLETSLQELKPTFPDPVEREVQAAIARSRAGLNQEQQKIKELSGGQRKRLSLHLAFVQDADLLLLDEPTNHLDWEGILDLEGQLKTHRQSLVVISHDREFIRNQCLEFMEVNPGYEKGYFSVKGTYEEFLLSRDQYISGAQSRQEKLANKVRRETEWLRAGVKARTTKSVSRSKEAHQLIDNLDELQGRQNQFHKRAQIKIETAGKQSKQFFDLQDFDIFYGDKTLIKNLTLRLGPGQAIGLLGSNGSGKTSFVRALSGQNSNHRGVLKQADDLRIIYLDQKRETLDEQSTPLNFLGEGSEYVHFAGQSVHAYSYASRFLLTREQLDQPISRLSGGERARLLIAKLLLQPADVFILDEPTNDLDMATMEILEGALSDFPGLTILVSHDRYFLRQVCDRFLSIHGDETWAVYADLDQWLSAREPSVPSKKNEAAPTKPVEKKKPVKLSYKDKRALETIEEDIAKAEDNLELAQQEFSANSDFGNHVKVMQLTENIQTCQREVERLYQLWQELEEKSQPSS